jgi:hypothetical protein
VQVSGVGRVRVQTVRGAQGDQKSEGVTNARTAKGNVAESVALEHLFLVVFFFVHLASQIRSLGLKGLRCVASELRE